MPKLGRARCGRSSVPKPYCGITRTKPGYMGVSLTRANPYLPIPASSRLCAPVRRRVFRFGIKPGRCASSMGHIPKLRVWKPRDFGAI